MPLQATQCSAERKKAETTKNNIICSIVQQQLSTLRSKSYLFCGLICATKVKSHELTTHQAILTANEIEEKQILRNTKINVWVRYQEIQLAIHMTCYI